MKSASSTNTDDKKRRELAEYFVCKIERKFCSLPTVTRQLVIQAFETGYKAGQLDSKK